MSDFVIYEHQLVKLPSLLGNPNGQLLIYHHPKPNRHYTLGVDVGSGVGLSNSVIHVNEVGDLNEPEVQAAEWACDFIAPKELAGVVNFVGNYYWDTIFDLPALAAVEDNNKGTVTIERLATDYNYPHLYVREYQDRVKGGTAQRYGYETKAGNRTKMALYGYDLFTKGGWIINSPWMLDEMADFDMQWVLKPGAIDEEYELVRERQEKRSRARLDRVMAGLIAVIVARDLHPRLHDQIAETAERNRERLRTADLKPNGAPRKDFQNTSCSLEDMMNSGGSGYDDY